MSRPIRTAILNGLCWLSFVLPMAVANGQPAANPRPAEIFQHSDLEQLTKEIQEQPESVLAQLQARWSLLEAPVLGWSRTVDTADGKILMVAVDVTGRRYFDTFYSFSMNGDQLRDSALWVYGANIEMPLKSFIDLDGDDKPEFLAHIDTVRSEDARRIRLFKFSNGAWVDQTSKLMSACMSAGYCVAQ